MTTSRKEAVALAEAMIRDGRLPSPGEAATAHAERERERAEKARERARKQAQQPAQVRKRQERDEALRRRTDLYMAAWRAEQDEKQAPPRAQARSRS
jgi:hypothetical protein